ncbi:MAG: acyltransferase [Candidatus Bathyarchaeia archaeon]
MKAGEQICPACGLRSPWEKPPRKCPGCDWVFPDVSHPESVTIEGHTRSLWGSIKGRFVIIGPEVKIGRGSVVWNLVYIGARAQIGEEVKIGSMTHIDYETVIGDRTLIEGCAYIPPLSRIGRDCFLGPNVTLTNDPYPPTGRDLGAKVLEGVTIEDGAIIGAAACIRAGVTIHKRAVVGMGAVVTRDVPQEVVVLGNPAKFHSTREAYEARRKEWMRRMLSKE